MSTQRLVFWRTNRFRLWGNDPNKSKKGMFGAIAVFVLLAIPSGLYAASGTTGAAQDSGTAPLAVTSVAAAQAGASADITVTWVPATTGTIATGAVVQMYDLVNGSYAYLSDEICGASCTSADFRNLSFGTNYEALVYATTAGLPAPPVQSQPTTPETTCAVGACVSMDATAPIGKANLAASGILSSVFNVGNVIADMAALGTTMFRSSPTYNTDGSLNWTNWNVATKSGAQTTLVLSDLWSASNGGNPPTPWSDWSAYTSFISSTVSTIVASGEKVTYFEPYNEPGDSSYYSAANYATVTPALLLQQFLVTYQAIRSVDPDAAVVGPSLAVWSDYPNQYGTPTAPSPTFDMATFLNYAAANGIQLAAVTWHEINDTLGPNPEENTLFPAEIEDQVATVRRLIAGLPALGNPLIFISEYGMPEVQPIPGWDVSYLSALTDAQVNSAGRACWPATACANPTLDGLLANDGVETEPDYWVRSIYASFAGNTITTSSSNDFVTALGSFDSSSDTLTGLIGRGEGCTQDAICASTLPGDTPQPPIAATITLTVPWADGTATVALSDVPGQSLTPIAKPVASDTTATITPAGSGTGTITIAIPSFADGDAYGLTVTPLDLTTPPTTTTTTSTTTTTTTTTTTAPPATTTTTAPSVVTPPPPPPPTTTTTTRPVTTTTTTTPSPATPPPPPPASVTPPVKAGSFFGSTGAIQLNKPIVGMASTPDGKGYWLVASDGGIFNFGDAAFYGSTGALRLNKPIVGMASTPDGKGYWLVASDGGIFTFGDAGYFGSTGALQLAEPIVAMASTPDGKGYWLVASDGGIFNYGDAAFYGSAGAVHLNKPIVGFAPTANGKGYWLVASDGGIFTFGDAGYYGSTGALKLTKPIVGMSIVPGGGGYRLVASDGGIFDFGNAAYYGSTGADVLNRPIVGMAANQNGYWLVASDGGIFSFTN